MANYKKKTCETKNLNFLWGQIWHFLPKMTNDKWQMTNFGILSKKCEIYNLASYIFVVTFKKLQKKEI